MGRAASGSSCVQVSKYDKATKLLPGELKIRHFLTTLRLRRGSTPFLLLVFVLVVFLEYSQ